MESKQKTINEIVRVSKLIKEGKEDVIVGFRKIHNEWFGSELPEDSLFNLIVGIEDATDTFIKGEDQKKCSAEFLAEQSIREKEELEYLRPYIEEALDKLLQLPVVEIPEDPYAWPFEEYK